MERPVPGGFLIRPARETDCSAINAIYNHYVRTSAATLDLVEMTETWRLDWFRQRTGRGFPVFVAATEGAGEIVGWCSLAPWSPKAGYGTTVEESIYIAGTHRRRGLGRALLGAIVEEARVMGKHVVMAGVTNCQEASLGLHEALGFERSGLNRHMGFKLGAWHDVAHLQRHIWRDDAR